MPIDLTATTNQLKELIVREMELPNLAVEDLADDAALVGGTLGLDSIDLLQLAIAVEVHFAVPTPDGVDARRTFATVNSLACHIVAHKDGE